MSTISPLSPPIVPPPPETAPPSTDEAGYTQTVTQGGGTGTPDDPAVIIITSKKNSGLDSYSKLMAYGGMTGDQYNASKDLAFAQMSPEERCAALGVEANASAGIDEGCDSQSAEGLYQEVASFEVSNSKLQELGVEHLNITFSGWLHTLVNHSSHFSTGLLDKSKFYDIITQNPNNLSKYLLQKGLENPNSDIKKEGTWIKMELSLPYNIGTDRNEKPTNKAVAVFSPIMFTNTYILVTAYPIPSE